MSEIILNLIDKKEDLLFLSKSFKEGKIRMNISKIAKKLNVDRKTVKRYLDGNPPKKTRNRGKYLTQYRDVIKNLLNDEIREFEYIDHLYRFMKREYSIKCNRVTFNRFIRQDKDLNKLFKTKKDNQFTVRFNTSIGQQIQFDLKEKVLLKTINKEPILVYIPTITFGWSRYNYRKITLDTKTTILISFLSEAFENFGGVPDEIVIDNLKAFVEKARNKGNPAILNSKFEEFCKDYNIKVITCIPRRPQTKGKTETQNKIVDELKNYSGYYNDIEDIHDKLTIINDEDNNSISQATHLPRNLLFNKEKGELNPLPIKEIRLKYHLNYKEVQVSNESLISYKSHKYSVPKKYIGFKVGLVIEDNELHIYYNKQIITKHKITNKYINIKPEHKLYYDVQKNELCKSEVKSQIINELRSVNYD